MTGAEVLAGLKAMLEAAFPELRIYTDREESGFQRPAALVQVGRVSPTRLTAAHIQVDLEATVTAFVAVDPYHNSASQELQTLLDRLFAQFEGPAVQIGDRWAEITAAAGDSGLDYAELKLKLRWTEAVEKSFDGGAPPMENFTFRHL